MDVKKENFKRIAESRTNKILTTIKQLQNLTNTSFYDYDNEDIDKMFDAIEKELKRTRKVLKSVNEKEKFFEL